MHNTLYGLGLVEVRKGSKADNITIGNREKVELVKVRSITGFIINKKENKVAKDKLKNISCI